MSKNKDINKQIAERIAELRLKNNLTVEKLAWKGGLSKSCVGYAVKGTFDTRVSTIAGICAALKISPAEFFSTFTEIPEIPDEE